MSAKARLTLVGLGLGALAGLSGCMVGVGVGGGHVHTAWVWGSPGYHLAAIGDTGIQYVADVNDDIFFHLGIWYRWYGGGWYSCRTYGGAWVRIAEPPVVFLRIPPAHVKYRAVKSYAARHRPPPPAKGPQPPGRGPGHPGRGPGPHGR
jgi:hypothetical protein